MEDAEELSSVRVTSELSELDGAALVQQGRQMLQQYKLLKRLAPAHEAELRTIEQDLMRQLPSSSSSSVPPSSSPATTATAALTVSVQQSLQARQARLLWYRAQRARLRTAVEQLAMRLQDRLAVHLSFSDSASER